jgi:hypothetical protein
MSTDPLPEVTLDDLPQHRRDALLWRYAMRLDYGEVDELVRERSLRPCIRQNGPVVESGRLAVLGDDGRYHLCIDGTPVCRPQRQRKNAKGHRHEMFFSWWTDGTIYRIHPPQGVPSEPSRHRRVKVTWIVTLTRQALDPALIPHAERCPMWQCRQHWPPYDRPGSDLTRIRAAVIAALGPGCHACRHSPGLLLDHDHFDGWVRGIVCRDCNTHLDKCPHLAGCPWADYLNNPPARALQLRYPRLDASLRHNQRKIDYLGIDPFFELRGSARG